MSNLQEGNITGTISGFADIVKKYISDSVFRKNVNNAIQSGSKVMGRVISNNEKTILNEINKKIGKSSLTKGKDTITLQWKKSSGDSAFISVNPTTNIDVWVVISVKNTENFTLNDEIGFTSIPILNNSLKIENHTKKFVITINKVIDIQTNHLSSNLFIDQIDRANHKEIIDEIKSEEPIKQLSKDIEDDTPLIRKTPILATESDSELNSENKRMVEKMTESICTSELKSLFETIRYF